MKQLLLTGVMAMALFGAFGQEDSRPWMPMENRIGIAVGIGSHTFQDQNCSPLVYQSKPKNVRLFYQLESNDLLFSVDVDVRVGNLMALNRKRIVRFEEENLEGEKEVKTFPVGGSFLGAKVALGAFYKLKSTQESTFKVAVGLRIADDIFYPDSWTTSGLMNSLNFSPHAIVQHRIDEHHKVMMAARLPLLAYVTRPPYHNSVSYPNSSQVQGFFKNSQWVGIGKYSAPEISLSYDYQISNRIGTGLSYDFAWYQVKTDGTLRAVSHAFRANIYTQF